MSLAVEGLMERRLPALAIDIFLTITSSTSFFFFYIIIELLIEKFVSTDVKKA
jgi:hypothetical protein